MEDIKDAIEEQINRRPWVWVGCSMAVGIAIGLLVGAL